MGRKVSIGVGVLLLLCAFGRGLTYDQCDVLLSTVGTFEWTYGAPCSGMTYTIPGSAFYRREVLFGTDCMVGHFESYIRSPGENFLTNLTGYTSGGFKLTAAAGYDIRLRLSHSSDRCFPRLLSARYYFAGEQVIGAWNAVQISKAINADTEKCANGGFRTHDTSDSCFCLPGFSGPTCTQACGWNKIGASCELTCSDERRGCRGSVFCDAIFGSSCSCASGFQGPDCSLNCGPKLYGANCLQPCGMCVKGGSCDPITGHCLEDCEPGYLRPFCHEKLTHLRSPPHIFEVGATSLNGSFPTTSQETLGRGSVLFYQPQYKVQSIPESNWVSSSLGRYIPDGNEGIQVFEMDNLPPNSDLIVRILLLDQEMRAYDSPPFVPVRTGGRSRVENLKLADVSGRSANLTWSSHDFKMGDYFFVRHECLSMVGCPGPCPHRGGIVTAATTSITLQELLPAATYRVTVEAADNHKQAIIFTTNLLSPDASVSSLRVSARTNSSALLEWGPSDQCEWVFGPVALYAWSLQPLGSKAGTATVANTTATSTVLTGLQPLANYQFSVNLFNTEGKSPESRIATLNFSTHHTVPDPPRDLTAYRLNRTAVWLRWRAPSRPSGTLRAYIIDTTPLKEKGDASRGPPRLLRSERLPVGSHCGGYPEFVCFTVARLRPQSRYTMTVSAVNEHGDKPGEPASVEATTIKGVSEPPQDLRVVSQGKNHAVLAWGLPDKINGDLTFFEVAVVRHVRADEESAETDVPDPDVERITVGKEQPQYEYRVEGLQPGATYAISVNCGRYGKASHLEVTTDDNDEAV